MHLCRTNTRNVPRFLNRPSVSEQPNTPNVLFERTIKRRAFLICFAISDRSCLRRSYNAVSQSRLSSSFATAFLGDVVTHRFSSGQTIENAVFPCMALIPVLVSVNNGMLFALITSKAAPLVQVP